MQRKGVILRYPCSVAHVGGKDVLGIDGLDIGDPCCHEAVMGAVVVGRHFRTPQRPLPGRRPDGDAGHEETGGDEMVARPTAPRDA